MERTIGAVVMSLLLVTATFTPVASAAAAGGSTLDGYGGSVVTETDERLRSWTDGPNYGGKRSGEKPGKAGNAGNGKGNGGGGKAKGSGNGKGNSRGSSSNADDGKDAGDGKKKGNGKEKGNGKNAGGGKKNGHGAKAGDHPGKNGNGPKKDNPGKARGHGKDGKANGHGKSGKAKGHGTSGEAKGHGKEQGGGPPAACGKSTPASERASSKAGKTPPGLAKKCGTERTNRTNASLTPPSVDGSLSALELRVRAWRLLADAPTAGDGNRSLSAAEAEELRETLNGSFVHFVGFDRVNDRAVFEDDKEVAAAAGKRAPNVTAHLIVADEKLARTALGDAERVYERLGDGDGAVDEDAVERELEQARQAVAQAEHVRSKSPNPVAAVTHYRRAWTHAQRALDLMDAATEPGVEITERADPPHDGPINYTVRGTVTDVRPWLVGNVTVSVNGEERTTTPVFVGNATPGRTWGFATTVRLEEPVNRIEVTATDSGTVVSDRSQPYEPNEGADVLRLDADRLPDVYEANRTTTDPLDPDSDAAATNATEGDDGTGDGSADLDGDRLSNVDELEFGTDPLAADTDSDGLTDSFELMTTDTDPLDLDTDGDGTPDGEEDPDGDGLTNAEEERHGSDPSRVDGDADGLADPDELRVGTDPLLPDTDDDGLLDGRELEAPFNTDPLDPDTDDDGLLDGEETYTTTVANESLEATVDVTGAGDAAAAVDVESDGHVFLNNSGTRKAGVSSRIRVDSASDFQKAEVTLGYDESAVDSDTTVAVYRYVPQHQTFVQFPSTVDRENGTVSTTTSKNGTYVAFNVSAWDSLFEEPLPSRYEVEVTEFGDRNVTCSGSGQCDVDGGAIVLGNPPQPSTSSFGGGFSIECLGCPERPVDIPEITESPPTDDGDGGGVDIDPPEDLDECPSDPATEDKPCFVVTATGLSFLLPEDAQVIDLEFEAEAHVPDGDSYAEVRLVTPGVTEIIFSRDTEGTTGRHTVDVDLSAHDGETVSIEAEKGGNASIVVDDVRLFVDSDGDGLSDNEEREGFRVGWGETVTTDVHKKDTDEDDLTDEDEVRHRYNHLGHTFYIVNSDPTKVDSDEDNIDDEPETDPKGVKLDVYTKSVTVDGTTYTGPYRWDPDKNNDEVTIETHPLNPDSDDDGLGDGTEQKKYHTRADRKISYNITRIHQDRIVDEFAREWRLSGPGRRLDLTRSGRALGLLDDDESADAFTRMKLDDATDDFDFVTRDDRGLVFRALDDEDRTDTWLANRDEGGRELDPWDPDSDDDGLTDGQEVHGVTSAQRGDLASIRSAISPGTNAKKNDTDGDGYWDGWIGVYGVDRTDNVVLYMEHLRDEDMGIQSDEIVSEQTELHNLPSSAPSDLGFDMDGDDLREHSKVHLGELHWQDGDASQAGDPDDPSVTPDPSLVVEVDHYAGADKTELEVLDAVERNYAFYGMNVTFTVDQELSDDDLYPVYLSSGATDNRWPRDLRPPTSYGDASNIETKFHDDTSKLYMFISSDGASSLLDEFDWSDDPEGVASSNGRFFLTGGFGVVVFTEDHTEGPLDTHLQKTTVHEIGHHLGAGLEDDSTQYVVFPEEVYSGEKEDNTKERVFFGSTKVTTWSTMSSGWGSFIDEPPMGGNYIAFSIEELATIEFDDIDTVEEP